MIGSNVDYHMTVLFNSKTGKVLRIFISTKRFGVRKKRVNTLHATD